MTRLDLIKNWDIIEAFKNGAEIECIDNRDPEDEWGADLTPSWSNYRSYRVKPQPKLVPLTFEDREMLRGKYLVAKEYSKIETMITTISEDYVVIRGTAITYSELMDRYTFLDGSPCGKME